MNLMQSSLKCIAMLILMTSFSQCSSTHKLETEAPIFHGQAYYIQWIAGVQGGGSGIDVFIPTKDNTVAFDSIYFRNMVSKLAVQDQPERVYVGHFKTRINSKRDVIMSSDNQEEFGNVMPDIPKNSPFELKDSECILSFLKNGKTHYYKITNLVQKEGTPMMSAPPNRQ